MRSSVLPVARMRFVGWDVVEVVVASEGGEMARLRMQDPCAWKRKVSSKATVGLVGSRGRATVACRPWRTRS